MKYLSVCSGIEAASVAWHGFKDWEPVAFCEVDPFCRRVLAHRFPQVPNFGDMNGIRKNPQLVGALQSAGVERVEGCWSGELPAKGSVSPDLEGVFQTLGALSHWNTSKSSGSLDPAGLFGKTSPGCSVNIGMSLGTSSPRWSNTGMGSATEFWTLNTSESPRLGVGCLLSRVLENGPGGPVHQRFYKTGRAAEGVIRRARKRGRWEGLPLSLRTALEHVAGMTTKHKGSI